MRADMRRRGPVRILDTVKEFEQWPWGLASRCTDDEDEEWEVAVDEDAAWNDVRPEPIRATERIGRNQLCPCGSGKKYKKCCARNAPR
jgi:hypothetical protein